MADDPNHFYVTLLSTAWQERFPDNKLNVFTIELALTKDLGPKDRWEVRLCEITCPPQTEGMIKPVLVVGDTNALIFLT